jgi:lipoate-protein ligase B
MLLQHTPVYTFGRRVHYEHLLLDAFEVLALGADLIESDRGGAITFHGPGQLVGYPILDLKALGLNPSQYVHALEQVLVLANDRFGIATGVDSGRPGVWCHGAKIASIGVRVKAGITTHGFALNVTNDLAWFDAIVPCGISGVTITSLEKELDVALQMATVESKVTEAFKEVFDVELEPRAAPALPVGTAVDD